MLLMTGLIALLATTEPAMAHPATGPTLPAVSAGVNPFRSYVGGFVDGEVFAEFRIRSNNGSKVDWLH